MARTASNNKRTSDRTTRSAYEAPLSQLSPPIQPRMSMRARPWGRSAPRNNKEEDEEVQQSKKMPRPPRRHLSLYAESGERLRGVYLLRPRTALPSRNTRKNSAGQACKPQNTQVRSIEKQTYCREACFHGERAASSHSVSTSPHRARARQRALTDAQRGWQMNTSTREARKGASFRSPFDDSRKMRPSLATSTPPGARDPATSFRSNPAASLPESWQLTLA